jgi:hypothetical protein
VRPLRRVGRCAALAILSAGLLSGSPAGAGTRGAAAGFPRLALYGSIHGSGSPYYNAPADTAFDTAALDAISRYDEVILDVNPITPYRPALLGELRARNPDLRALAYLTATYSWPAADPDSLNHVPTRYRRLVRDLGGFLYNSVDGQEFAECNINLARRDGSGRFIVAEALADFYASAILGNGPWDGMFIDTFCSSMLWMQDATHQADYVRAGYPTLAAFDAAWGAATDTLARRLRRQVAPGTLLVGNCIGALHRDVLNGGMRENFPQQGGGTWTTNMLQDPNGYFADDRDFVPPAQNYLSSWVVGGASAPYSAVNARKVRYGLASASLGEGYGVFGPFDRNSITAPYHLWWYDEYAVDVVTGRSATDLAHTHWLGMPRGGPYQMIWAGTNPDASTNPGFETDVTTGWNLGLFAPAAATLTRDTATSAVGGASAHISITALGVNDWDVNFSTASTLPLVAGMTYAATFWARASAPRTLPVEMVLPTGGGPGGRTITIGTQWQQYQVLLQPGSNASAVLEFFLGNQVGDVWFDDVHFQQGATSIWRRDFENGIVLVNPTAAALQVALGGTFRRILGTVDPVVNDGSRITTAAVPAGDGLFLLGTARDSIPPAAIRDGRVAP